MASKNKRLRQALAQINTNNDLAAKRRQYDEWMDRQPWSTRRAIARGTFQFSLEITNIRRLLGIT